MNQAIVMYLPAIHLGYVNFLKEHTVVGSKIILINGQAFAKKYPVIGHLERDLRALSVSTVHTLLESLFQDYNVFGINAGNRDLSIASDLVRLNELLMLTTSVVMPDEEVSRMIVDVLPGIREKTRLVPAKLRWDKNAAFLETPTGANVVTSESISSHIQEKLKQLMDKSVDWWRRVACVAYRNQEIIFGAYNKHLPSDGVLNVMGDPRSNFTAGEMIEYCSAIHAEASLIACAAKTGTSLEGAILLVTDFPCPNCAKLIAQTGIKELIFIRGYSKADGKEVLEAAGITLKQISFE